MNLDELKNTWKEEDKHLENKIRLNENLLLKMNLENTTGAINKIINKSLIGRNLALLYCFISIGTAVMIIEEIAYSLPAIMGGLAMLWSFVSHLAIEKPNYTVSLVQLQKTICNFRIHMAANAKYDIAIVAFWLLTLAPIYLKYIYKIPVYSNPKALSIFVLISVVVLTVMIAVSQKAYKKYDQILKNSEAYLSKLIEFENK
ncbi:hypothetical protein [Adhaeribacter rhizoryzae]|uniref:Uncharacterized protein n=1 Tax=Adhaeribacter rhizoryzae TaxID=2607907 RepID=A0A5M6CYP2_9BACT|nr:hypothetical protein [Adhaeribacter rhizoryzae]KAA5540331.1 hypothetical protein F0145_22750 [Adhaeribacter rhizoryzae]